MTDDNDFIPHNDLERQLLDAQEGRLAPDRFMQALLEAQVFLPVQDDPAQVAGLQTSDRAVPLSLTTEDGMTVVPIFTSPDRAQAFLSGFPDFNGGILAEFRWVAARVPGCGISLNPGWPVGLDVEPEQLRRLVDAGSEA